MTALSAALTDLLLRDGKTLPDAPDRDALVALAAGSPWLRFALGIAAGEPLPDDDAGLAHAAAEFAAGWAIWDAYRRCLLEVRPPGAPPLRFRIHGAGAPLVALPASTFAIVTAWNPGSGEPRPNERANRRANEQLAAHLDARMVERWPAVSSPGGRWREESFVVLGLDLDEAWRIGEAFQQRAIYYIDRGRPLLVARRRARVVSWEGALVAA
jgi:hypothetical protein